jgi:hypothetical protein
MLMAIVASVTVSMAALTIGVFSNVLLENREAIDTSFGINRAVFLPDLSRTSLKVRPSNSYFVKKACFDISVSSFGCEVNIVEK